jgi:hypothetical protein
MGHPTGGAAASQGLCGVTERLKQKWIDSLPERCYLSQGKETSCLSFDCIRNDQIAK